MLVVIAFHPGDAEQALRFATWTKELGGCKGHDLILVRDTTCDPALAGQIQSLFSECFDTVEVLDFVDHFKKWPDAPNAIFGMVARHVRLNPRPWLFCEPDCVPLKAGWLDLLEAEYREAGKPFLGDFVSVHTPELDVPDHMSGNAIYPGDMMQYAGVALIAGDTAWDVVAAPQIVPQMHRSRLIHHSWKSPGFSDWEQFEREVLAFKPDCALFHADKAGTLYPLLRERAELVKSWKAIGAGAVFAMPPKIKACTVNNPPVALVDIFIKTYPADYPWLKYCLRSIGKFASGFRKTIIVSPGSNFEVELGPTDYEWQERMEYGLGNPQYDGYLSQQVFKLYADTLTDAEFILFLDSDTIFTCPVTPETYFKDGKIEWMHTPWEKTNTPWRPIVEKFMGQSVEFEFMRRHPTIVPRWLLSEVREFCLKQHGMPLDQYVMSQPHRAFSEFNVLGAFAYAFHHDKFTWINTEEVPERDWPALTVRQEYSWGGLHQDIKDQFETILGKEGDALWTNATASLEENMARTSDSVPPLSSAAPTFEPDSAATATHANGAPILATLPQQVPWESKEQSLEEIRSLAGRLQKFCDKSSHVRAVRLVLHQAAVIELPYRFRRRKGKWKRKAKK